MSDRPEIKTKRDSYKRFFDRTVLVLAHVLLLPIWVILWLVIPILIFLGDRGPVFYRQLRAGKDGQSFTLLKFRTMVLDADRQGPAWTTDDDPRVTKVGRVLRRTGLDELPEILSIWKGEMSLVGPRALDVEEQNSLEDQIPTFGKRLSVAPGLTGMAQIYDRSDNAHDKLRYDLEYVEQMSPWLDVRLLAFSVLNTLGARWDQRRGKPLRDYSELDADLGCGESGGATGIIDPSPEERTTTDRPNFD